MNAFDNIPAGINGLPAAITEIARLQTEIARLQEQVAFKESEFWRIQRNATELGERFDREVRTLRGECERLRIHKIQVEEALHMLGTDDPANVILRLEIEARELRRKVSEQGGHIKVLESKLALCDEARMDELEKALHAARAETDSLKMALQEARAQAQAADYEASMEREAAEDAHRGEIYDLERKLSDIKGGFHAMNTRNIHAADRIAALEEELEDSHSELASLRAWQHVDAAAASVSNAGYLERIMELEASNKELNHEVAEYADAVDDLQRQIRGLQDDVIYWRGRHQDTWHKGQRLWRGREQWKAWFLALQEDRRRPLNPAAPEFVPTRAVGESLGVNAWEHLSTSTAKPPLNPDAPEFSPAPAPAPAVPQTFREAVIARIAEKKAAEEAARAATVEAMKDAVRARLAATAEKPSMTITEVDVVPDHTADWEAYKSYCIERIKKFLNDCVATSGRENKCAVCLEMYRFTKDHGMPFVRAYKKFYYILIAKCWELLGEKPTDELKELLVWHIKESKDYVTPSWEVCEHENCFRIAHAKLTELARGMRSTVVSVAPAPSTVSATPAPVTPSGPTTRSRAAANIAAPVKPQPPRRRTRTQTGAIPRRDYTGMDDDSDE